MLHCSMLGSKTLHSQERKGSTHRTYEAAAEVSLVTRTVAGRAEMVLKETLVTENGQRRTAVKPSRGIGAASWGREAWAFQAR